MSAWKNRLCWLVMCLAAAVLYLFENNLGTRIVLLCILLLPPLTLPVLAVRRCRLSLTIPDEILRGDALSCTLRVRTPLPVLRAECTLRLVNSFSGGEKMQMLSLRLAGGKEEQFALPFPASHCGLVTVCVASLRFFDPFGIFALRVRGSWAEECLVLPHHLPMEVFLREDLSILPDSDRYSMTKSGSDPSETFRIREYIPGDSLKSIHWKLSQKTDELLVREYGLPVVSRALLLLEGAGLREDTADAAAELLFTVSDALRSQGICHTVCRAENGRLRRWEISSDSRTALRKLLSAPPDEESAAALLARERSEAMHTIIVGAHFPSLPLSGEVTVLSVSDELPAQSGGISVLSCRPNACPRRLVL